MGLTLLLWTDFTPRGQIHPTSRLGGKAHTLRPTTPLEPTSPLGNNLTPKGQLHPCHQGKVRSQEWVNKLTSAFRCHPAARLEDSNWANRMRHVLTPRRDSSDIISLPNSPLRNAAFFTYEDASMPTQGPCSKTCSNLLCRNCLLKKTATSGRVKKRVLVYDHWNMISLTLFVFKIVFFKFCPAKLQSTTVALCRDVFQSGLR
jgi:hypothetical protein